MKNKSIDENLVYILKNTTPYQRMVWLKKAFEFWKIAQMNNYNRYRKAAK